MQVFKKIWFFIILIVLITAVSGTIYEIALGNHHLVQDRSKSFYQILREPETGGLQLVVGAGGVNPGYSQWRCGNRALG